ncbi:MAG TPA: hypothetical protein EYP61_07040 [Candidatus Latescibacteria bacterium]|nr:hypothetical protein [Candidatus Latescibacterota bacterium]
MLAGWAVSEITPPVGAELAGYFQPRKSEGVLDPLMATALYVAGEEEVGIVSCDLIGLPEEVVRRARGRIEALTGVSGDKVMISATHTHTGPVVFPKLGYRVDEGYLSSLADSVARTFAKAKENAGEASLRLARGKVEGISFNRRYRLKDGTVVTNPPKDRPDILGPAGPVDRDLTLLVVEAGEGTTMLVNFALHPDTLDGNLISADYIGVLRDLIRAGFHAELLFLQGAAGDVNHLDPEGKVATYTPHNRLRIGRAIFREVERLSEEAGPTSGPVLSRSTRIEVGLRLPSPEEVEEALSTLEEAEMAEGPGLTAEDLAKGDIGARAFFARELLRVWEEGRTQAEMELQAVRLADLVLVGVPAEVFAEVGMKVREASPLPNTSVVELANGAMGYFPTERAFSEGGYETMLNSYSRLAPDTEGRVLRAVGELTKELV